MNKLVYVWNFLLPGSRVYPSPRVHSLGVVICLSWLLDFQESTRRGCRHIQ